MLAKGLILIKDTLGVLQHISPHLNVNMLITVYTKKKNPKKQTIVYTVSFLYLHFIGVFILACLIIQYRPSQPGFWVEVSLILMGSNSFSLIYLLTYLLT